MTILSDIPDANEPVLQKLGPAGPNNYKLARRAVDEAISDISPYLTDAELAEAADALHTMVNRWRDQRTA
tara:strand:+ start:297 stop:506 length:210 start_codon:yes stop_codon:yes gene_type:complete